MKYLLLAMLATPAPHAPATPVPGTQLAMCTAVQVCSECPGPMQCIGNVCTQAPPHQCGCHMECLPGTH